MNTKARTSETHLIQWKESWCDEYLTNFCGFADANGVSPPVTDSVAGPDIDPVRRRFRALEAGSLAPSRAQRTPAARAHTEGPVTRKKQPPADTVRSSASEYLTFVAATGAARASVKEAGKTP